MKGLNLRIAEDQMKINKAIRVPVRYKSRDMTDQRLSLAKFTDLTVKDYANKTVIETSGPDARTEEYKHAED